jgi:hypothetical protein
MALIFGRKGPKNRTAPLKVSGAAIDKANSIVAEDGIVWL